MRRRATRGSEALKPHNLICRAVRAIKTAVPEISVVTDVALDPYTSHGHDGLLRDGVILNDDTVAILAAQAVMQAEAGSDIIAPSDMMDGRVGAIRTALDGAGYTDVQIMAYTTVLRLLRAVPRRGRHQRDWSATSAPISSVANGDEALREAALDIEEGADMIMVKPGLPYLDIVRRLKDAFAVPTFAYQVSGEYAMIEAAARSGWLDGERAMMESLLAFKRAGADGILTYFAPRAAGRHKRGFKLAHGRASCHHGRRRARRRRAHRRARAAHAAPARAAAFGADRREGVREAREHAGRRAPSRSAAPSPSSTASRRTSAGAGSSPCRPAITRGRSPTMRAGCRSRRRSSCRSRRRS